MPWKHLLFVKLFWAQNYQTIWSFICWSDDDEDGGKDPELFWELGGGGTTLFEFVVEFRFEPEIGNIEWLFHCFLYFNVKVLR